MGIWIGNGMTTTKQYFASMNHHLNSKAHDKKVIEVLMEELNADQQQAKDDSKKRKGHLNFIESI